MYKHHLADIQSKRIGNKTTLWQFVVVLPNATIGSNCNICAHVFIENEVIIGNNVTIKNGVQIWDGVTIEDNVFIGPNVTFTNDLYPKSKQHLQSAITTLIQKGASIGANTTILAGVTIGSSSLIGAGSVVSKDVPPYTIWYGNPAKHKGYLSEEGLVLDLQLNSKCGKRFKLIDSKPTLIK